MAPTKFWAGSHSPNSTGPVPAGLGIAHQEKTSLEQEAKAGLLVGGLLRLGLLHHLHVVVMMMVVVPVMVAMMMVVTMMMMLCRRRFRGGCADHRHRESNCSCKPEGREEGLLHGSFPSFAGR